MNKGRDQASRSAAAGGAAPRKLPADSEGKRPGFFGWRFPRAAAAAPKPKNKPQLQYWGRSTADTSTSHDQQIADFFDGDVSSAAVGDVAAPNDDPGRYQGEPGSNWGAHPGGTATASSAAAADDRYFSGSAVAADSGGGGSGYGYGSYSSSSSSSSDYYGDSGSGASSSSSYDSGGSYSSDSGGGSSYSSDSGGGGGGDY